MLTRADVTQDDTVLITGASGGVGSAAIQLARARGARVLVVTSASKARGLMQLGAAETFERDDDLVAKLGANSVDVVIDLVAGPKWPALLDVLRPGGRYAGIAPKNPAYVPVSGPGQILRLWFDKARPRSHC